MTKHKARGKDKKKGSQLVIRVDKSERDAFVALCDRLDTSAAREIRRFMRELVAAHPDETPAKPGETESAVIAGDDSDTATSDDASIASADVAVDAPAKDSMKPKKSRAPRQKA